MKKLENGIHIPEGDDSINDGLIAMAKDVEIIGKWMIETDKKLKEITERLKGGRGKC